MRTTSPSSSGDVSPLAGDEDDVAGAARGVAVLQAFRFRRVVREQERSLQFADHAENNTGK